MKRKIALKALKHVLLASPVLAVLVYYQLHPPMDGFYYSRYNPRTQYSEWVYLERTPPMLDAWAVAIWGIALLAFVLIWLIPRHWRRRRTLGWWLQGIESGIVIYVFVWGTIGWIASHALPG